MGEVFRKEFTISLDDPASIQAAINAINTLKEKIPIALDRICNYLVQKGVTIAQQKLSELCVSGSGDLYQSIRFERSEGGKGIAYVVAGYPDDHMSDNERYTNISYAVFVEYGYGTANYYDTTGSLVDTQSRIDRRKELGEKPSSGRHLDHPSGNHRYRDAETYGILKGDDGQRYFGWKYMDRKTGEWHTSHGQNPKPFMYKTLMELSALAERDAGGRMMLYMAGTL